MSQKVIYNKIYGCPQHGNKHGNTGISTITKNGVKETRPCFICHKCNKVFYEPSIGKLGRTGETGDIHGKRMEIWNTLGPRKLPSKIYVYTGSDKKMCNCTKSKKQEPLMITHLLLENGETIGASGARECPKCHKIYIKRGMLKNIGSKLAEFHVEIVDETAANETASQVMKKEMGKAPVVEKKEVLERKEIANTHHEEEWEKAVFEPIEEEKETLSIKELKPASKVASAYYDAKIDYNPYQYLPWLKMFVNGKSKLLISDEVGLGKTIEAGILIMEELTDNVNAQILVVCPAFLREKWYYELKDKFMLEAQVFDGKTQIDSYTKVVILPISRLKQYQESDNTKKFDMVVVDEIHYFKNSSSARYSALKRLLQNIAAEKQVFMSATPVNNSGNDYHSIERLFGGTPDKTNTTKKQAYINLPERHIEDVYVDFTPDEQKFYDATDMLDPFSGTIYRHIGSSCLYALSKYAFTGEDNSDTKEELQEELREAMELFAGEVQSINDDFSFENLRSIRLPDIDSKLLRLNEIIEQCDNGKKIVIFSHYIETVKYIYSALSEKYDVGYIYANNISNNIPCKHAKNRFEDAKAWFDKNNGGKTILICSDSCREGIDLDAATILINYDLPFNPSILEQRIGRIDRMSQKHDMEIFNFHINNTYDDRLHFILNTKLRFINFYADYGIGNPLNISAEGNNVLISFIRYFGKKFEGIKQNALMSNDDFNVASRLLRKIGVAIEKREDLTSLKMQAILLDLLNANKEQIVKWFDQGELKRLTDEQLYKQREELDRMLGFPKKVQRKIVLGPDVIERIVAKSNSNVSFRVRISPLICGYAEKLKEMEDKGNPMLICAADFQEEYIFGEESSSHFVPSSIIEIMRKEGAKVYDIE